MLLKQAESGPEHSKSTVHTMNPAVEQGPSVGRRSTSRGGFTLVETMVATILLTMIILGILQVLIGSYRVAAKARYADHARYVIKSLADQFMTQYNKDNTTGATLPLFTVTLDTSNNIVPLGSGLAWTNTDGTPGVISTDGTVFYVLLGDNSGAPITASVSREVCYLDPTTGNRMTSMANLADGVVMEGDFSITYQYLGVQVPVQTITAVRAIP
jgi:type II secretory pathway pseudopilin PulG